MSERFITITEVGGEYRLGESAFNKFELLGLLEQIVFDLKNGAALSKAETENEAARSERTAAMAETAVPETAFESSPPTVAAIVASTSAVAPPAVSANSTTGDELRTGIGNAVRAIRDLGGANETVDLVQLSETELQAELEALTEQYKRLKTSRAKK